MASEVHRLDEVHRQILRRLMAGAMTNDDVKPEATVPLDQLADEFNLHPEQLREAMLLLETLGYVHNLQERGGDPTMEYKNIEAHSGRSDDLAQDAQLEVNPTYRITEWGQRLVAAEMMSEGGGTAIA
jgi:DNA-binding transcriptional regulator YhcF (GntR family)